MNRKYLFIGGESDGIMMGVWGHSQYCKVPIYVSLPEEGLATQTYRREAIQSGDEEFEYFVLDSISTQDAIRKLIDGYKADAKP